MADEALLTDPWWIAVYTPTFGARGLGECKAVYVERFQAKTRTAAFFHAVGINKRPNWKLTSVAREEMVVY